MFASFFFAFRCFPLAPQPVHVGSTALPVQFCVKKLLALF
jgi:hypothetical protein